MLLDLLLVTLTPPFIVLVIAGYMLVSAALMRRLRDRRSERRGVEPGARPGFDDFGRDERSLDSADASASHAR